MTLGSKTTLRIALRIATPASPTRTTPRTPRTPRIPPLYRTLLTSSTATRLLARPRTHHACALPHQTRSMFIQTETTPNQHSLKFVPGCAVMQSGTHEFVDTRASMSSPLAKQLFHIHGVVCVFYGADFVTVSKDASYEWCTLKPEIYSTIMEFFSSNQPLFTDSNSSHGSNDTVILDTDSEVVAMIKELLDTRIRPSIQQDGGDLEYLGFTQHDGIVKVKLKGSCRGCISSTVTLKNGIQRLLMHYIPEVSAVEHVLDPEEQVARLEFRKLEHKLESDRLKETQMGFSL